MESVDSQIEELREELRDLKRTLRILLEIIDKALLKGQKSELTKLRLLDI